MEGVRCVGVWVVAGLLVLLRWGPLWLTSLRPLPAVLAVQPACPLLSCVRGVVVVLAPPPWLLPLLLFLLLWQLAVSRPSPPGLEGLLLVACSPTWVGLRLGPLLWRPVLWGVGGLLGCCCAPLPSLRPLLPTSAMLAVSWLGLGVVVERPNPGKRRVVVLGTLSLLLPGSAPPLVPLHWSMLLPMWMLGVSWGEWLPPAVVGCCSPHLPRWGEVGGVGWRVELVCCSGAAWLPRSWWPLFSTSIFGLFARSSHPRDSVGSPSAEQGVPQPCKCYEEHLHAVAEFVLALELS